MKNWIITSLFLLYLHVGYSQGFPAGIPYQAQVHSSDGGFLTDATVGVEFNIRSGAMDGMIVWQERHTVTLNNLGHLSVVIGEGASTGEGTAVTFAEVDWAGSTHFLEMLIDEDNIGDFVSSMTQQMMAVPYAFHAKTTSQTYALYELSDVDVTGIEEGDVLKWDGENWVAVDSSIPDTLTHAFYSDSANFADTAFYAINCDVLELLDSAGYTYHADTAFTALYAVNNWGINGNDNVDATDHFLGTIDSVDLAFRAFNTERMRIKANGLIGIGTEEPLAGLHVNNTNGVLYTGEFGVGSIPTEGAGSRMMWYPRKAAFRSGFVTGTQWNDGLIGNYSFAAGYNARASGTYAVAFGFNTQASGEGAMAVGNASISSGDYSFSAGHNPQATGNHSIAIGRGTIASQESAIAIGYHSTADAPYAMSLGHYTYAHGNNSLALGYHAEALHEGSFIYNDKIDVFGYVETTANNQFMVKASGGTVFYTSSDLTTGVELLPGAGAWSILSDREKKENIQPLNKQDYLNRLDEVDVYSWSYKSQDSSITHVGPMAQDFYNAFQLGIDSTIINSGDFDGINLLLIKALDEKMDLLEMQTETMEEMETELAELKAQREKLYQLLLELETKMAEEKMVGVIEE